MEFRKENCANDSIIFPYQPLLITLSIFSKTIYICTNSKYLFMKRISFLIFSLLLFITLRMSAQDTVKVSTLAGLENTAEKLYNSGIAKFSAKDYNGAITDFTQSISINPNFYKAYYNRGIVRIEMKNVQDGISDFDKAISLAHDSCVDCYFSRAQSRYSIGSKTQAAEDYGKVIQLNPSHAQAYYYRGGILFELGEYKSAIEDFDHAIKLKPDYAYAYNDRGSAKRQRSEER